MDRVSREPIFLAPFESVGRQVIILGKIVGEFLNYLTDIFSALLSRPFRMRETIQQIDAIGVRSIPVILFCVSFAAAVTLIEYAYHMKLVIQTTALVPGFAALLVLRELGAMLTALLLTSRVGAGITAEIGSMKITEQIDALRLLNVEPVKYLVAPRLVACIFSSMALVTLANGTCLFFLMLQSAQHLNTSWEGFMVAMNSFADFKDFALSIVKAGVFGAVIPVISCFYGFQTQAGAEGVGRATTQSVVANAVSIIVLDFLLTFLFSYLY